MADTVNDLVTEVRRKLDEDDDSDLSNALIVASLNRAQKNLARIVTKRQPSLFKSESTLTSDGTRAVTLPNTAFGLMINEVDIIQSGVTYPVEPAELSQLSSLDVSTSTSAIPSYYGTIGKSINLYPKATSGTSVRVRFQKRPPKLVESQGRINEVSVANGTVTLDAVGSDLTTDATTLGAFVNIVDSELGEVKATLQVSGINTTTKVITFKSSGLDRSTVYTNTVATAIPTTVSQDDFICSAKGTAVPFLFQDYDDYLVQFALVEIRRDTLSQPVGESFAALRDIESDIKKIWAGRAATKRVAKKNPYWGGGHSWFRFYR